MRNGVGKLEGVRVEMLAGFVVTPAKSIGKCVHVDVGVPQLKIRYSI